MANDQVTVDRIAGLARTILKTHCKDLRFAFAPDLSHKLNAAEKFIALLQDYHREEGRLSASYTDEAARKVDADLLDSKWATADQKFWMFASFSKKKVVKELADLGGTDVHPDVQSDSPKLRRMKELLGEMDALSEHVNDIPGFAFLNSKVNVIQESTEIAAELQRALPTLIHSPDELVLLKASVRKLVVGCQ